MLKGENISKYYLDRSSGETIKVLDQCSITIGENEVVGLMGASGCGKSTLARILLRLIKCDSGRILFENEDITDYSNNKLKPFRGKVQFISQRPESFFDPMLTLGASFIEPLKIFQRPYTEETLEQALGLVKLNWTLLSRYPHQVSGGEIQRLSIARALLLKPKLLILDEPTSMLDISVQAQILHLLKKIQALEHLSYLFIAHDKEIIKWMCDRSLFMERGRLKE